MRLRLVKEPFDNPDYIFELKHDGFRALAYIESGKCRLVSRNLKSLRFESLRLALGKLFCEECDHRRRNNLRMASANSIQLCATTALKQVRWRKG